MIPADPSRRVTGIPSMSVAMRRKRDIRERGLAKAGSRAASGIGCKNSTIPGKP
jgi:hypothetical protein